MNEIVHNRTIFETMEEWAPLNLAYDWDNVGLQVGSFDKETKKVMITLDVLESVVDEAIEKKVDLIIAHHPMLFKPLKKINLDDPKGRIIEKLIKHDITVYASHTNLDIASGGVNDLLANKLKLQHIENLVDVQSERLFKLAVYVPETRAEGIRGVLGDTGAGHIGSYSHSSFNSRGQGMFKPLDDSSPYLGKMNEMEIVNEIKIETIIKEDNVSSIIDSMIKVHPYEEVVYDIFPLENKGNSDGIGRVGLLQEGLVLKELSEHVKTVFEMPHVRVTGNLNKMVEKVAILGGSGEDFVKNARQANADVYITGDMTFHNAQDAMEMGLSVIDAGHYIEKIMKKATESYLKEKFDKNLTVIVSEANTDPFQFI